METREIVCPLCGAVLGFLSLPEGALQRDWEAGFAAYSCVCEPKEEVQE